MLAIDVRLGVLSRRTATELLAGLGRTLLKVSAIAIAGAFVIGLVLGAARAYRIPVVSQIAAVYVEVIRNTPILVQIFFALLRAARRSGSARRVHRRLALRDDLGRRVQHRELPRRLRGRARTRYREAGAALGFGRFATFLNVTLPIGGRIALPSSINTYISVVKNTSLMYVIGYPELTTTALNINALTLADARDVHGARRHLPDDRLDDVRADPPARGHGSRCRRTR